MGNVINTLGGYTEAQLGLKVLKDKSRKIISSPKTRQIEIPDKHGSYYDGADLMPISFTLECAFFSTSYTDLATKMRALSEILLDKTARPKKLNLIYAAEPEKYYEVYYAGEMPIEKQLYSIATFLLPLVAYYPAAYSAYNAYNADLNYDNDLDYDNDLFYPNNEDFTWVYQSQGAGLYNHSPFETPFEVSIAGTVTNPKITLHQTGEYIQFNVALNNQTLNIKEFAADIDGENAMPYLAGDFFKLAPGDNGLVFEGTNPNCQVEYTWRHRWY